MKIKFDRLLIERLLANSPHGEFIGIDTDEGTINVFDADGRGFGTVNVSVEVSKSDVLNSIELHHQATDRRIRYLKEKKGDRD